MTAVASVRANVEKSRVLGGKAVPYILALVFIVSALWNVWNADIVDTDAARHAMNGAFIYDLIRTGHLLHPVDYAEQYYGHLPALSMPYHPPLFPAIEALFFAVFGVKLFTARLTIAMFAGITAILLFRLIEHTLENRVLAICVTFTTLWLWTSQQVAQDVMLEYPSMAFALAALLSLGKMDQDFTVRRGVLFGIFAGAAFWSKQHTAFLFGVIVLYPLLSGRWRLLLRVPVFVSLMVFGTGIGGYILLSRRFHNAGIHGAASSTSDLHYIANSTLPAYYEWILKDLAGVAGLFALTALVLRVASRRAPSFKLGLYWAWIISTGLVLADLGATNNRYLFFLCPATIAIGYEWIFQGSARFWGKRAANFAVGAFALLWLMNGLFFPREYLHGPAEAAKLVVQGQPTRILYAGEADGNFIFAVRVLDPALQTTVIPAAKLPATTFQPAELEAFCRMYGVNWVILENVPIGHSWSNLEGSIPAFLKLERTISLESSRERWRTGSIGVYRVQGVTSAPGGVLKLPVWRLGGDIEVKL